MLIKLYYISLGSPTMSLQITKPYKSKLKKQLDSFLGYILFNKNITSHQGNSKI